MLLVCGYNFWGQFPLLCSAPRQLSLLTTGGKGRGGFISGPNFMRVGSPISLPSWIGPELGPSLKLKFKIAKFNNFPHM